MDRINQRDPAKLAELMAPDHLFIDSLGQAVRSREKMLAGWRGYFAFCPDCWVSHDEVSSTGNIVVVFGAAGGTIVADGNLHPENQWRIPAAWRAVVENGLVQEWRVYADNQPVRDILARIKAGSSGPV